MTTQTEALKLALELLAVGTFHSPELQAKRTEVIEQGLNALAQPELCKYGQEPKSCTSSPMDCQCALDATFAQPEQEPVAWMIVHKSTNERFLSTQPNNWDDMGWFRHPLYTTPPQRKPLTDEQIVAIYGNDMMNYRDGDYMRFARAIEAAHGIKEKNT